MSAPLISKEAANRIANLKADDIYQIIQLASFKKSPESIYAYAKAISEERRPELNVAPNIAGSGDGGASELARIINQNPGLYGAYTFEAKPTGQFGSEAFAIDLGGNLMVRGQNKKVAIAAARIIRVKGRHYQDITPYCRMYSGTAVSGPNEIEKSVYDGKLAPGAPPPPSANDADNASTGAKDTGVAS